MSLENLSSVMCNQVTLKMVCSVVEATGSSEILDIASMDIIPSTKRITDVQADLCLCCLGQVMRKHVLCHMRTTKVQISLRIRAV